MYFRSDIFNRREQVASVTQQRRGWPCLGAKSAQRLRFQVGRSVTDARRWAYMILAQ